jgi:short-subunit dehydrogenase
LRDKTFAKMDLADFQLVMDVHVMGSVNCTKAVWQIMREQNYGRIVMTTSSSGMYGNFGQTNYGAAKMAVLGFMNTLVLEGAKNNIRVNALSPTAATRMTEDLLSEELLAMLQPKAVTAGLITLCHEDAPNRLILCAGAGGYASTRLFETDGAFIPAEEQTGEAVLSKMPEICDTSRQAELASGPSQTEKFLKMAAAHLAANA